jgi:hypothetical protein
VEWGGSSESGVGQAHAPPDVDRQHGFRHATRSTGDRHGWVGPFGWTDAHGLSLLKYY